MEKPKWVIAKEQAKKQAAQETVWLFGLHAVRDALLNPKRERLRLVVTRNALDRLGECFWTASLIPITSARFYDPQRCLARVQ